MDTDTYSNKDVIKLSNKSFINVRIDADKNKGLWENTFNGEGLPSTFVVDGSGDIVLSWKGYLGKDDYLKNLNKVSRAWDNIKMAGALLKKDPASIEGGYYLACAYLDMGKKNEAVDLMEKVVNNGGKEDAKWIAMSHERLARIMARRNEADHAREHLTEYRKLDPKNTHGREDNAAITEGLMQVYDKQYGKAIDHLSGVMEDHPKTDEMDYLLYVLAVAQYTSKKKRDALKTCEKFIKEHKESSWIGSITKILDRIKKDLGE